MPQIIPITTTVNPDFQTIINYNLHWSGDYFRLAQKFVVGLIESNPTMERSELKELIERNSMQFLLSVNHILKELF